MFDHILSAVNIFKKVVSLITCISAVIIFYLNCLCKY